MIAIITIGCSGSGKSTWAKEYCQLNYQTIHIERDIYRESILNTVRKIPTYGRNIWEFWQFKHEYLVTGLVDEEISRAHKNNLNIVISDTNLNITRRNNLHDKLKSLGYSVSFKCFGQELTLEDLWKRDLYRKNSVGHSVIAKQYDEFRKEFPLHRLQDTSKMKKSVIFDIDGTLAHMNDKRGPFEWSKVNLDEPDILMFDALNSYISNGYKIIILSGRDSCCRKLTTEWLNANIQTEDYALYMRQAGDIRKDTIIKSELFFKFIDGNYDVIGVFDDRPSVCRMWRELGLKVYHCTNPYIEF